MNERFKFRVWNGMNMEYDIMVGKFGVFYVNPSNNGIDENDTASLSTYNTKYPDDITVMQYTGLVDKNGKDIYEGDICELKYYGRLYKGNILVEDNSFEYIGSIIFEDGCFLFCNLDEKMVTTIEHDSEFEIEVIGNKYE